MLNILIPSSYIKERMYIIKVLFQDFLGLKVNFIIHNKLDYIVNLPNQKRLIIKDGFFSKIPHNKSYLNKDYIPKNVPKSNLPFICEKNIPIIYGNEEIIITEDTIICGLDLFASSYFMLTRWEEYVNKSRDLHNRFPARESLAYKFNFLNRPVVNEYVEMLWNMLVKLGLRQDRKKRSFKFINTHDVDHIYKWNGLKHIGRVMLGDIIKRKSICLANQRLNNFFKIVLRRQKDPFDTFNWLMDLSEKKSIKSRFYFMNGGQTNLDNNYKVNDKRALSLIKNIKERGHVIGFHPSYNTYNNLELFKKEKLNLEKIINQPVKEGRQHYLRFDVPNTWQIWHESGMERDLTLSYADKEGFRCGTCYEFQPFNFLTKERLGIYEYPLISMEASFITYQKIPPDIMIDKIINIIDIVKKYNGNFVFLWHNSSFENLQYKYVYEKILQYA